MLAAEPIKNSPRGPDAPGFDIAQSPLDTLDGLHAVEQGLVRLGVLHHELGSAVDGQHQRMARLPETVKKSRSVSLEITERADVVRKIDHAWPHHIRIKYHVRTEGWPPIKASLPVHVASRR
jgi:hypothetical protein